MTVFEVVRSPSSVGTSGELSIALDRPRRGDLRRLDVGVLALAEAIDKRYRSLVLLAGFGGLRVGELLGLRRCDLDLMHRVVHVRVQALEVVGSGRIVTRPKSEAGVRSVALPASVLDALQDHVVAYGQPGAEGVLFTAPLGGPARRASVNQAWHTACRAVGVDGVHVHDLRHHAATVVARTPGVTTKELMARIGHSSPRAALLYQHATEERDRRVADFLEQQIVASVPVPMAPVVTIPRDQRVMNAP
jgi:integrase